MHSKRRNRTGPASDETEKREHYPTAKDRLDIIKRNREKKKNVGKLSGLNKMIVSTYTLLHYSHSTIYQQQTGINSY